MREIEFIGPEMAMEHASFQMFKHINYKIGVIVPRYAMLPRLKHEFDLNIKSIDSKGIHKCTESQTHLNNGSSIYFTVSKPDIFRGIQLNTIFSMYEPIQYELKLQLIPLLAMGGPNTILYTVYDR